MALLDLTYGQEKYLMDLIVRDNPELMNHPAAFYGPLGDVIDHGDGTASVFLLGIPGKETDVQISGKVYSKYSRIDLDRILSTQPHALRVYRPSDSDKLLEALASQYGIVIPAEAVTHQTFTRADSGTVVLELVAPAERCFVFTKRQFTLRWARPTTFALSDAWVTTGVGSLQSPTVVYDLAELSKDWYVPASELALIDVLAAQSPGVLADPTVLVPALTQASQNAAGAWDAARVTGLSVVSNNRSYDHYAGLQRAGCQLDLELGNGDDLTVHYDLPTLSKQPWTLADSESSLRSWLTALAPSLLPDSSELPQLFNVVTTESLGHWVIGAGTIRNLTGATLISNQAVPDIPIGNQTYNRVATLKPAAANSLSTAGLLTVYYNALT